MSVLQRSLQGVIVLSVNQIISSAASEFIEITMSITLYTAPVSIGWVSHIALEESGLPYKAIALDFSKQEQAGGEYLKINAKARVPSLVVEEGVITETPAILTYLAQIAPDSPLGLPNDPFQEATINAFNCYLCSTVHVAHAHKMRGHRWVDDEAAKKAMTDNVPKTMGLAMDLVERDMLKGPWVHGDRFSTSDPYLYRMSTWMESDGVDVNNYPKVLAHRNAMDERASVQAVKAFFA